MRLMIAAPTRSGTSYMTHVLQSAGVRVRHENWRRKEGRSDPTFSSVGYTFVQDNPDEYDIIFHQLRNPLHQMASAARHVRGVVKGCLERLGRPIDEWAVCEECLERGYRHCQTRKISSRRGPATEYFCLRIARRLMEYWYHMNLAAEKIAGWRYKIEDFAKNGNVRKEFWSRLGMEDYIPQNEWRGKVGTYVTLTWGMMQAADHSLAEQVRAKAEAYGYQVE